MSDAKEIKRIKKAISKMRFVTRTKWELPIGDSKPYWNKVCEGIESKVLRVRKPSPSSIPYPTISPSILYSTSSASCDDINVYDFIGNRPVTKNVDSSSAEPIVKVHQPTPQIFDNPKSHSVKFQSNHPVKESNDPRESFNGILRLTKLSKMTKLVNDFLSSTRNRVRPSSASSKSFTSIQRRTLNTNRKTLLKREKSFDDQSKDDAYRHESPIASMTRQKLMEKVTKSGGEVINSERKIVGFRNDIVEMDRKKFDNGDDMSCLKMGRPRAPSLSIASALPSFGKVVISIEDIDSTDDEKLSKSNEQNDVHDDPNFLSKETDLSKANEKKMVQDFLRVPEIKTSGHASYPLQYRSKFQDQVSSKNVEQLKGSNLTMESHILHKKRGFWPRKPLVNIFRALRPMNNGVQSKVRIESDTNRYFDEPLEIYSTSSRSSISSDDPTDFIDTQDEIERNEDTENDHSESNELNENVGKESESSYASVRERLMRNAQAHIGKDFQSGRTTYEDNVRKAISVREDPSSFYNDSSGNRFKAKLRSDMKTNASCLVALPRVASIFPRIKADKCLACMCQSLRDIDQPTRQLNRGTFYKNYNDESSPDGKSFDFYEAQIIREKLLKQSYREITTNGIGTTSLEPKSIEQESKSAITPVLVTDSTVGTLTKTASLVDDLHKTRPIGRSTSKTLVNAKSLIASLSLISERSKSNSDQDDSDQGFADGTGNDTGLGAGTTSKYLAPCHMPINLKPSLEPLRGLRYKKSRSIRSRVASAEKSVDSSDDDDDDSDDETAKKKILGDIGKIKSDESKRSINLSTLESSGDKSTIIKNNKNDMEKQLFESIISDRREIKSNNDFSEKILSDHEVFKISMKCIEENKSPIEILRALATEYSKRLSIIISDSSRVPYIRKNVKIANKLLTLLVDSRNYLNREKCQNDKFDFRLSSKQPALCNSRQLRRILPLKSYNLVAPILGMAEWYPRKDDKQETTKRTHRFVSQTKNSPRNEFSDSAYDLIVHPPSRTGQVSFEKSWKDKRPKLNPYSLFLSKPRRKAITWRPLTERDLEGYDPEATLKMRASKITDRISKDFCNWLDSLAAGTNQTSGIDVDVLKDMFETDFTAEVCRTMQLSINEMPMVPSAVAIARCCPNSTELALTRRQLIKDAKAEMKPKRTIGFGTALPDYMKFVPPKNHVNEKWLQCKNVPKDLETMDAVWKGIIHLSSVKGFINWLKAHPEVSRPKALENALTSRETLLTRQSQEIIGYELDLDQIQSLKVGDNDLDAY